MTDSAYPNPDAWVDLYGDYLYRYALLRLKSPATAEDVVQETFLAAMRGLDRFDGRTDIKYWLRGILRNKIVDYIRRAVREDVVEDPENQEMLENPWFRYAGITSPCSAPWQFDTQDVFEKEEFWSAFRDCLNKLKEPLRTAFTLKMLEELPSEEICKILKITANNLWVMMHRARNQLKACLEHNWTQKDA